MTRVSRDYRGPAEVAVAHRRRRHRRLGTSKDGLVVRPFIVRIEKHLAAGEGSADASAPPLLVRVGKGIATLDARERLVVRQGVQAVAVEVVKAGAAVGAGAALGRHHNARQAPILGAVGIREHSNFRDRVKARRRVADSAEDGVGRRLPVLDVRHAVGLGAQELDVVGAADHVRVEQQEGLDVPAIARQVVELLLVEAANDGLALERDVVARFSGDGDDLVEAAELERNVHERRSGGAHQHARPLELLEVRRDDLDTIGPRSEVRRFIPAFRIRLERSRHTGRVIDDEYRRALNRLTLRIDDCAADCSQERLRECRSAERER